MKIEGTYSIDAAPQHVYEALNDPEILQQSIPGCEKMERTEEDNYNAHLKIGIASIKGNYLGKVRLRDKQPHERFTLEIEGKGSPGFVKGTASIQIAPDAGGSRLSYSANVQVGGLIAAVGSRVVEAAAKKMAAEFFQKFSEAVGNRA
ncbi:MAG: carbon monoxide dehydrogenase subunit G [Verrucomicrobia bacterium]|nr:carbon monoxide dehydrogenase subunit G [Verrucomicrobiota bacterium]